MIDIAFLPFTLAGRIVGYALTALIWTWLLWVFFLAVMHLRERRDAGQLSRVSYACGVPVLIVGYALDFAVNVTVCTVLLAELPHETTVTARLKRHKDDAGWRGRVARWVAAHLLDAFDPDGKHI